MGHRLSLLCFSTNNDPVTKPSPLQREEVMVLIFPFLSDPADLFRTARCFSKKRVQYGLWNYKYLHVQPSAQRVRAAHLLCNDESFLKSALHCREIRIDFHLGLRIKPCAWETRCFSNLRALYIPTEALDHFNLDNCPVLETLHLGPFDQMDNKVITFHCPATVKHLVLKFGRWEVKSLPEGLLTFRVRCCDENTFEELCNMPVTLKTLSVDSIRDISTLTQCVQLESLSCLDAMTCDLLRKLPSTLAHLGCESVPCDATCLLPPRLASLSILSKEHSVLNLSHLTNLREFSGSCLCAESVLPENLISLDVCCCNFDAVRVLPNLRFIQFALYMYAIYPLKQFIRRMLLSQNDVCAKLQGDMSLASRCIYLEIDVPSDFPNRYVLMHLVHCKQPRFRFGNGCCSFTFLCASCQTEVCGDEDIYYDLSNVLTKYAALCKDCLSPQAQLVPYQKNLEKKV